MRNPPLVYDESFEKGSALTRSGQRVYVPLNAALPTCGTPIHASNFRQSVNGGWVSNSNNFPVSDQYQVNTFQYHKVYIL